MELEYRRRDHEGGGWPGTNEDILSGLRRMGELHAAASGAGGGAAEAALAETDERCRAAAGALRPDGVVLVGHSAGGCLALWAAHRLAAEPGPVRVAAVLAAALVTDLGHEKKAMRCAGVVVRCGCWSKKRKKKKVSDESDCVELYMKCLPESDEEAYRRASPAALLPVTFPVLVAYGDKDAHIPPRLMAAYAAAARAGAPQHVVELNISGADHMDVVNAGSDAWKAIAPALADLAAQTLGEEAAASLRS